MRGPVGSKKSSGPLGLMHENVRVGLSLVSCMDTNPLLPSGKVVATVFYCLL